MVTAMAARAPHRPAGRLCRDASPPGLCGRRESRQQLDDSYSQYATVVGLPPDGSNTDRRGLLSKEDRYGFKLAVGSGAGRSARILHHPIHQGQSDDVVLCALGLSQGRWLDRLAGVSQRQDRPPGSSVSPSPRHRLAGCALDGARDPVARIHQTCPAAAQAATLIPADTSPAPSGALAFQRSRHPGAPAALHPDEGVARNGAGRVTMTPSQVQLLG